MFRMSVSLSVACSYCVEVIHSCKWRGDYYHGAKLRDLQMYAMMLILLSLFVVVFTIATTPILFLNFYADW